MTAVGVELDSGLAAEARWRAERLGVADRFEVVCADATSVRLDGLFDVVAWSQFFFEDMTAAGFADAAVTPAVESPLRIVHATRP